MANLACYAVIALSVSIGLFVYAAYHAKQYKKQLPKSNKIYCDNKVHTITGTIIKHKNNKYEKHTYRIPLNYSSTWETCYFSHDIWTSVCIDEPGQTITTRTAHTKLYASKYNNRIEIVSDNLDLVIAHAKVPYNEEILCLAYLMMFVGVLFSLSYLQCE